MTKWLVFKHTINQGKIDNFADLVFIYYKTYILRFKMN